MCVFIFFVKMKLIDIIFLIIFKVDIDSGLN